IFGGHLTAQHDRRSMPCNSRISAVAGPSFPAMEKLRVIPVLEIGNPGCRGDRAVIASKSAVGVEELDSGLTSPAQQLPRVQLKQVLAHQSPNPAGQRR